jgi:hypothetical protein
MRVHHMDTAYITRPITEPVLGARSDNHRAPVRLAPCRSWSINGSERRVLSAAPWMGWSSTAEGRGVLVNVWFYHVIPHSALIIQSRLLSLDLYDISNMAVFKSIAAVQPLATTSILCVLDILRATITANLPASNIEAPAIACLTQASCEPSKQSR